MSTDSQELLSSFNALPKNEQQIVAAEILRRAGQWETQPLSDEELVKAADDLFEELDRREEAHGN